MKRLISGSVEPQSPLLKQPPDTQELYKVMSIENFLKSVAGNYLHFQRIDAYKDFASADKSDGEQLPQDKAGNQSSAFAKDPSYNAASYYDGCRSRTYACCFSLENSEYIWNKYGGEEGSRGKICIVFAFGKLRQILNQTIQNAIDNGSLMYGNSKCHQIFSINYGIVEYVKQADHQLNSSRLPDPIQYTYIKDAEQYGQEKELRISLSALGIGNFVLADGSIFMFPPSIKVQFDFKTAFSKGIIKEILCPDPNILPYVQLQ